MQTSPSSEMHAIIPVVGGGERQKVPLNTHWKSAFGPAVTFATFTSSSQVSVCFLVS